MINIKKKKRERAEINKIINEKKKLQPAPQSYKGSLDYYEQLYANKTDTLEETDKLYNFPRLNQEETENVNRPITSAEIESVILKLPTSKSPGQDDSTCEFYKHLEKI